MAVRSRRALLVYVPVIHEGYLHLFERTDVDEIFLLDHKLVKSLSTFEPAIAALPPKKIKYLLNNMGYDRVEIMNWRKLIHLKNQPLLLVDDALSHALAEKYVLNADIEYASVFLRWDRAAVFAKQQFKGKQTNAASAREFMQQAYQVAENSGDWWRQVGAVAVKDNRLLGQAYNHGLPDDHTPYQQGAVRDYVEVGEHPELANYIHAEQWLIAEAAKNGIPLKDADLYVTHFPCPVCAKLIAVSQCKRCYFSEGSASLDGLTVMQHAGVEVIQVTGVKGSDAKNKTNA